MKVTLPQKWRKLIPAGLLSLGLLASTEGRAQEPEPNALKQKVQELVDEVISAELEIEVPHRRSKIMRMKQNIFRVAVADPTIIDFVAFGSREVELIGKKRGSTTLTFWMGTEDDARLLSMLVTVTQDESAEDQMRIDYGKMAAKINELFPDSRIQLIPIGQKLIVRGQARDEEEVAKILTLIRSQSGGGGLGGGGLGGGGLGGGGQSMFLAGRADRSIAPSPDQTAQQNTGLALVNFIHIPGEKQVLLKVRIAELKRTGDRALGATLGSSGVSAQGGVSVTNGVKEFLLNMTSTGAVMTGTFSHNEFNLAINALVANSSAKILAEPNLVTLSGTSATFLSGGSFPVPTVVGVGGAQAASTAFKNFGTELTFTPTIIDRDRIRLVVNPSVSNVDQTLTNADGTPGTTTRSASTTVDLREGQVLAIAGLIQDTQIGDKTALPYLGEIPGLNLLTANRGVSRAETELVILVSPELVHPMEPDQAPTLLPGMEVTEPNDLDLFLYGDIEGRSDCHHRSTVWPLYKSRMKRCYGSRKGSKSTQYFVHGDHGFSH